MAALEYLESVGYFKVRGVDWLAVLNSPVAFHGVMVDAGASLSAAMMKNRQRLGGPISTNWAGTKGTFAGIGQGTINIINGLQDTVIGVANLPAAGVNGIAYLEEKVGILDPKDVLRAPYIPSPDWSRDKITHEGGEGWTDTHNWSKFTGAAGVEFLTGTAIVKIVKARRAAAAAREAASNAARKGIPGATRLSSAEQATGGRLQRFLGRTLRESTHEGAEYIDDLGRTFDALGDPAASQFWNAKKFFRAIDKHLRKSNDFTAIDLTGFTPSQIAEVRKYLDGLSKAQLDTIIRIGF